MINDETFRIGVWRKSMKDNILLQRPRLGRTMERRYTMPLDMTYGYPNYTRDGGTAEAMKYGPLNERIKSASSELSLEKDFIKLNRVGIKKGVTSARDQKQFRAITDYRVAPPAREIKNRLQPPPNITFGIPSRPRSPMYDVVEHKFQRNWLLERKKLDELRAQQQSGEKKVRQTVQLNVTTQKRYDKVRCRIQPGPLWHMPRFESSEAVVQSFRTDLERERSFRQFRSEQAGQMGVSQRGIPIQATS